MHTSNMDEFSHIVLLARIDKAFLFEEVAINSTLDAGHWRLPLRRLSQKSVAPHRVFCGMDIGIAGTVHDWLCEVGLTLASIKHCQSLGVQYSPAWQPQQQSVAIVQVELHADALSLTGLHWDTSANWQQRWRSGELLLNPFSQGLLEQGEEFVWASLDEEQALHEINILPVQSHTLPPATHTNTLLVGSRDARWLVDPSPANKAELGYLLRRLKDVKLAGIFLTHHHGDHHQQCVALAHELKLPIRCSRDTYERIPQRFGQNYWQDIQVLRIEHGEILCEWKDSPVRVWAVPGHDAGQLALMPDNKRWILVGDLIQGIGTVVIAKPEGNMADYFASLRWVVEQDPMAIIPSHGQVMGSSFRIQETLKHRQLREQQVQQLHQTGLTIDDMVKIIYADVDKRLWPLAKMNIECHMEKLSAEDRL